MRNKLSEEVIKKCDLTPRMMSEIEARAYTGLGRSSIRKLGQEIGCIHHFGRRILYDRTVLDRYFDEH